MPIVQTTPPQSEPMTVAEARARLNIASAVSDPVVTSWIVAARQKIEKEYGLSMIEQTWSLVLDRFPHLNLNAYQNERQWWGDNNWGDNNWERYRFKPSDTDIRIPMEPLKPDAIQSVKYRNADDIEQTFDPANYRLVLADLNARLVLVPSKTWPITALASGVVSITFKAGYANANEVPELLKAALGLHIGYLRSLMGRDLFLSSDKVPGVREVGYTVGGGAEAATEGAVANLLREFRRPSL